jgi:hypothetical protein
MTKARTTQTKTGAAKPATPSDDLRVAHEIHTLNQLIYGHLAFTHPWAVPFAAPDAFPATLQRPTPSGAQAVPGWGPTGPWTG